MHGFPSFSHHHISRSPFLQRRPAFCIGLSVLCLFASGCQSGRIKNDISTTQENDLGHTYAQQIDPQAKFVTDGKYNRRILDIAAPVFAQAMKDRTDVSFRVRVIDDPEINAFSIPGGYIYLYRGLLDKIGPDDDAVACVIGHEAAHVVRRHVVQQMSDAQGKGLLVDVATLLSRSYQVNQIGGALYQLDQLHYSRNDEYEADRWGEKFAYNAGFDPSGMVRTFRIFEKLEKMQGQPPAYSEDHPISQNRILRALEQYRELRANRGVYVTDSYDAQGDRIAARKNDISYQALVLATTPLDIKTTLAAAPVSKDKDTLPPPQDTTPDPASAPLPPAAPIPKPLTQSGMNGAQSASR